MVVLRLSCKILPTQSCFKERGKEELGIRLDHIHTASIGLLHDTDGYQCFSASLALKRTSVGLTL